jgi:hypothetical protein
MARQALQLAATIASYCQNRPTLINNSAHTTYSRRQSITPDPIN